MLTDEIFFQTSKTNRYYLLTFMSPPRSPRNSTLFSFLAIAAVSCFPLNGQATPPAIPALGLESTNKNVFPRLHLAVPSDGLNRAFLARLAQVNERVSKLAPEAADVELRSIARQLERYPP